MPSISIVPAYGAVLAFFYIFLTFRVVNHRSSKKVSIGAKNHSDLEVAIRAHGNFNEYVPLALILFSFLEFQGKFPTPLYHALSASLTAGRILHFVGLSDKPTKLQIFRVVGMVLTLISIATASTLILYSTILE